jgi:P27 family predicted phage terminase small subunit
MGQRGPKPLPANVHALRGNPSKKSFGSLLNEFRPEVEIPQCPRVLWPDARREWKRITVELGRYGLVSLLDRGVLAMLCQEWARWQWAERKIAEANAADVKGEKGMIDVAQSGYRMQSVFLQISVKAEERYEKLKSCFGLSPSDRTRVTPSDQQLPLPLGSNPLTPGGFNSL